MYLFTFSTVFQVIIFWFYSKTCLEQTSSKSVALVVYWSITIFFYSMININKLHHIVYQHLIKATASNHFCVESHFLGKVEALWSLNSCQKLHHIVTTLQIRSHVVPRNPAELTWHSCRDKQRGRLSTQQETGPWWELCAIAHRSKCIKGLIVIVSYQRQVE